jgi:hypothetical protein
MVDLGDEPVLLALVALLVHRMRSRPVDHRRPHRVCPPPEVRCLVTHSGNVDGRKGAAAFSAITRVPCMTGRLPVQSPRHSVIPEGSNGLVDDVLGNGLDLSVAPRGSSQRGVWARRQRSVVVAGIVHFLVPHAAGVSGGDGCGGGPRGLHPARRAALVAVRSVGILDLLPAHSDTTS